MKCDMSEIARESQRQNRDRAENQEPERILAVPLAAELRGRRSHLPLEVPLAQDGLFQPAIGEVTVDRVLDRAIEL